jgi:uncharacterized protein (TIGR00255 family)
MILSMTGFGKSLSTFRGYAFESEVKSLNSRYLEITIKLPSSLQNKEYEIREALKNLIRRGKIFISLSVRPEENENETFFLNESKLNELLGIFAKIKTNYGFPVSQVSTILLISGIFLLPSWINLTVNILNT